MRVASTPSSARRAITMLARPCARAVCAASWLPSAVTMVSRNGTSSAWPRTRRQASRRAGARAHAATGRAYSGKRVVIVGDSIHDVRCGRDLGVRSVAVASGRTPMATLAAEDPDVLFDDFSDLAAALAGILG